jgi:hypothetical protein
MTVIDWNQVLENARTASFATVPNAEYHIRVEEPNATTSSTGKPMLKFRCRIMSGPHARASILTQQTLSIESPPALAMFVRFLKAFGLDESWLAQLGQSADLTPIAQALDGREATAVVTTEKWNDEDRNKINKFKPLTAGMTGAAPAMPGMPGMPAMPSAPGVAPVIPMPGVPTPSAVPQPAPAAVASAMAPPPPPVPTAIPTPAQPPAQPPVPAAVPVPPPPPVPTPQTAPQPPQPPVAAPAPAPVAAPAPAPAPAAPAFDFASLPKEMQDQLLAQVAAQQAAAQPQPEAAPPTPTAPAVVAPPLPY